MEPPLEPRSLCLRNRSTVGPGSVVGCATCKGFLRPGLRHGGNCAVHSQILPQRTICTILHNFALHAARIIITCAEQASFGQPPADPVPCSCSCCTISLFAHSVHLVLAPQAGALQIGPHRHFHPFLPIHSLVGPRHFCPYTSRMNNLIVQCYENYLFRNKTRQDKTKTGTKTNT